MCVSCWLVRERRGDRKERSPAGSIKIAQNGQRCQPLFNATVFCRHHPVAAL